VEGDAIDGGTAVIVPLTARGPAAEKASWRAMMIDGREGKGV
jgi:hypothetical protein